jgi:hypothetical protein
MPRFLTRLRVAALFALAAFGSMGCSDVGDSSALPSGPGLVDDSTDSTSADETTGAGSTDAPAGSGDGADSPPPALDASPSGTPSEDLGTASRPDSNVNSSGPDAGAGPAAVEGGGGPRESGLDAGLPDTATPDSGPADSTRTDASATDSGTTDATTSDATTSGSQARDANAADSETMDASASDSAMKDSGTPDAGSAEGGTLVPCTGTGQPGCVSCNANETSNSGVCTATEAAIVALDIAHGNLTTGGQLKPAPASCYECLNEKSCLDTNMGDVGLECGDAMDLPGGARGSGVGLCLSTLDCILTTNCQGAGGIVGTSAIASQEDVSLCYCGGNNAGNACQTSGTATNGPCVTQEAAGFGFAFSDNKDTLQNYGGSSFPSGLANAIFQCAKSNKCVACLP